MPGYSPAPESPTRLSVFYPSRRGRGARHDLLESRHASRMQVHDVAYPALAAPSGDALDLVLVLGAHRRNPHHLRAEVAVHVDEGGRLLFAVGALSRGDRAEDRQRRYREGL